MTPVSDFHSNNNKYFWNYNYFDNFSNYVLELMAAFSATGDIVW